MTVHRRPLLLVAAVMLGLIASAAPTTAASPRPAPGATLAPQANTWQPPGVQGMDVSNWQGRVDWARARQQGARFAFIKATEGVDYKSPDWSHQYAGAAAQGMLRGSYHRAIPPRGSGAAQARFFVANGGGWQPDGKTLPPVLDIEFNKFPELGDQCYNMTKPQLQAWISDFLRTMDSLIGRHPIVYTNTYWWETCVGSDAFGAYPLWIARYDQAVGPLPRGWSSYHIWQYSSTGPFPGDSNVWHASYEDLSWWARAETTIGPYGPPARQVPSLAPGQRVTSPNGRYTLVLQGDGNLVTYNNLGRAIWASGTFIPGVRLAAQGDGNLVLYSGNRPVWWTATATTADRIELQDDGNVVIRGATGHAIWDSFRLAGRSPRVAHTPITGLASGQQARAIHGQRLAMQTDGNLVLYSHSGKPLWHSKTAGRGPSRLVVQSDGNVVVYDSAGRPTWNTRTVGPPSQLLLQSDGNLVVYTNGRARWAAR